MGRRALHIKGINGTANPKKFKKDNYRALVKNPKVKPNSVQCIRTIISFNPKRLSYKSVHDQELGMDIASRFCRRKYPECKSIIFEQADNGLVDKNGHSHAILHCHILTIPRKFTDGSSVTHGATFRRSYPYTDEAVEHVLDKKPTTNPDTHPFDRNISLQKMMQRKKNAPVNHKIYPNIKSGSMVHYVHHSIIKAANQSANIKEFTKNLRGYGIIFTNPYKLQRDKGKKKKDYYPYTNNHQTIYHLHYYKHPTPKAKYIKITSNNIRDIKKIMTSSTNIFLHSHIKSHIGSYLRLQAHPTYELTQYEIKIKKSNNKEKISLIPKKDKIHRFRSKVLGLDTDYPALNRVFQHNAKIRQRAKVKQFHLTYKRTKPFKIIQNTYRYKNHTERYPGTQVYLPFAAPVSSSETKKFIKKKTGFPEPELVPRKVPKPKKPNISPTRALNSLMNSMEVAIRKAQNQAQYQAMIADSLRMYSEKKQKQAILMSQYQITKDAAVQRNDEIKQEIDGMRSADIQTQRDLQAERANREAEIRAARENDDGPTFNGPTLF